MKAFINKGLPSWDEYQLLARGHDKLDLVLFPANFDISKSIPQVCIPVKSTKYKIVNWFYITGWKLSLFERLKLLFTGSIYTYTYVPQSTQPHVMVSLLPLIVKKDDLQLNQKLTITDTAMPEEVISGKNNKFTKN